MGEPVADDHLVGVGDDTANPTEVLGDGAAQLRQAARVDVAEVSVGKGVEGGTCRPQPCRPRKGGELGDARPEVDDGRCRTRCRDHGAIRADRGGVDDGAGALAGEQVALGEQLVVGGDDDAAGDAEIGRQCSRRWQRRARRQPSGADRVAQPAFDLGAQAARGRERSSSISRSGAVVLIEELELDLTRSPLPSYGGVMIDAYCHGHGGRVHLGPDSIVAFGNAGNGMVVRWSCSCGARGSAPFEDVTRHHRADPAVRSRCLIRRTRTRPDNRRRICLRCVRRPAAHWCDDGGGG